MNTLKNYVEAQKCRKGSADGTTKKGAYWLAADEVKIRSYGGDGIGSNSSDKGHFLQLRHFRDGSVSAIVHYNSSHQNYGSQSSYHAVAITECETVEDVIVVLKGCTIHETHAFSENYRDELIAFLTGLGMPIAHSAPDDEEVAA